MKSQVIILVGPPLSGKDTYLKTIGFSNYTVISRDDILMDFSKGKNYSDSFKTVDQNIVDRELNNKIQKAVENKDNVIINMTNLSKKGRKRHLIKFPNLDYEKIAIVFPKLSLDEYLRRNDKRNEEQDKFIPPSVIKDMVERWEDVTYDEGFDKIIKL